MCMFAIGNTDAVGFEFAPEASLTEVLLVVLRRVTGSEGQSFSDSFALGRLSRRVRGRWKMGLRGRTGVNTSPSQELDYRSYTKKQANYPFRD